MRHTSGQGLLIPVAVMKSPHSKPPLPSKDDIVAFIGQQPGKVGTREIARAFGMKNADRAALKTMLRELGDEGRVEQRRKKLHHPGTLPHVVVADVTARDRDGELIAVPTEWDEAEHGPAPKIRLRIPRRPRPNEVAGEEIVQLAACDHAMRGLGDGVIVGLVVARDDAGRDSDRV